METGRIVFAKELSCCPFSAVIDEAEAFMRAHREIDGVFAHRVEDHTDPVRKHEALEFTWTPQTPMMPRMQGLLTVRPHGPPGSELQLTCWYATSQAGRMLDTVIAQTAIQHLLTEIIECINAEWHSGPQSQSLGKRRRNA